eukprot:CAMPEP_0176490014 /NCGR_PEP_ID=MMETSP0200_2-20121128/7623_1 /TAXON_ID=947934 /ORGANISM="Chaetoceros sp., Strain GSL56" /LENGTH=414 /DNA_ID=CAMNT_0017887249 /DNA_START=72 /DNA_END=1313 /DNA_ORIENTATION=+
MQDHGTTQGVIAAIAAPFFMALGFIIWDVTWKQSSGSAFALNLFKCNLASIGFVIAGAIFGFTTSSTSSSSGTTAADDGSFVTDTTMANSVGYLILSGFIGIVIGDIAWLEALRQLGASRVLVIDTIKPFMAVLLGWAVLGEELKRVAFSGIALTTVGILVVELERERVVVDDVGDDDDKDDDEEEDGSNARNHSGGGGEDDVRVSGEDIREEDEEGRQVQGDKNHETELVVTANHAEQEVLINAEEKTLYPSPRMRGYVLAIGNVVLDTYGSLLTKQHGGKFSSWSINLIRFGSAGIIMIVISCFMRIYHHQTTDRKTTTSHHHDTVSWYMLPTMQMSSWLKICMGVLFVTFICPALSNYALFQIALALALTLSSITPLYALWLEWLIHGSMKRPTWKSLGGATLAVGGVVIL